MYVSSGDGLRIRAEPSTEAETVEVVGYGTELCVTGTEDGWAKTDAGYVHADFLQLEDPMEDMQLLGTWHITAYAETGLNCANGNYPEENFTIACNSLPFGTEVFIEGVGFRTVEDRGPDYMGSEWLDIYMQSETDCIQWGSQYRRVWLK